MKLDGKTAIAAASALALAGMGAAPLAANAAPAASSAEAAVPAVEAVSQQTVSTATAQAPAKVTGEFGYSQAVLTPVSQLSGVFAKSAAVLCQSLPDYGCQEYASSLLVSAPGSPVVEAAVRDLVREHGVSVTMACACATNAPGGGAVANAEAQGVMLKALAALMGA